MVHSAESKRMWDAAADWWSRHLRSDPNRLDQVFPMVEAMLGDVAGKRILDAGAGEGTFARRLRQRGAHTTGVDFSRLISFAKVEEQTVNVPAIQYVESEIADLSPGCLGEPFDAAVCLLVLHCCPDINATLRALRGQMNIGATLVVCDLHPEYIHSYSRLWRSFRKDGPNKYSVQISDEAPAVLLFHHPKESLALGFATAHFEILEIHEPVSPRVPDVPGAFPLFIYYTLRSCAL